MSKLALFLVLLLSGCATRSPVVVEPVPVVIPEKPRLAVQDMPKGLAPAEELPYYQASLYQCAGYAKELKLLLKPAAR